MITDTEGKNNNNNNKIAVAAVKCTLFINFYACGFVLVSLK